MQALTKAIFENTALAPLPTRLEGGFSPALVTGLSPVHRAQLAAALYQETGRPLAVVCPDDTAAEAMAADIGAFLGRSVPVLVGRELELYGAEAASRQTEQRRLAVLDALGDEKTDAVVMTLPALLQRAIPPEKLSCAAFTLRRGDTLAIEDVEDRLIRAGYEPCDKVEGTGQFARRGGILDLFSPSEREPVRMEFWGDEIDALAFFDPVSQRRGQSAELIRVVPAAETLPSLAEGGRMALAKQLRALAARVNLHATRFDAQRLRATLEADAEALENRPALPAADRYMALVYPEFATALDYLPPDALILLSEPGKCAERAKENEKHSAEEEHGLVTEGLLLDKLAQFRLDWDKALAALGEFALVMADSLTVGRYPIEPKTVAGIQARQLPSYGGSAQTAADDVSHWLHEGYRCVVLTGDERRAAAMRDILAEKGIEGVYLDAALKSLPPVGRCAVAVGSLSAGLEYPQIRLAVLTDTQIARMAARRGRRKTHAAGVKLGSCEDLSVGDLVVHEVHGIGRFAGIFRMAADGVQKDYIKINYAGTDSLYVPAMQLDLVTKYVGGGGEDKPVRLSKLGGADWTRARSRAKAAAKEMAGELIRLYAARQNTPGHAFAPDSPWQAEFEDAFEYAETDDQLRCTAEIKADMEKPVPMDRLLCGDVGFGKTEVALRAVMKCVLDGRQAAILAPTTVLAQQHFQTAVSRFFGFPVKIGLLSRFSTAAQARDCLHGMADGSVDIVIGTHRLLQKDIKFKNLGLLIVDEEQRFGVAHKEHIKEMAAQVDVLTLSATPIPRTLNMALGGLRDMSSIEQPPQDRQPVETVVLEHDWGVVAEAIRREAARGGQVYYLHNRIDTIERTAVKLEKLLPEISLTVAHGRMDERELSAAMEKMSSGEATVLVCTTIIETGIDIPNVNTLIIEEADKLGLAQLHQLRGRVGRSSRKATAYLTYKKDKVLTEIAQKRLEAIRQFAQFNSGIRIAMRDLEIRGAGNLLGAEQSGHMIDVGFDMYMKLLSEAVQEARGESVPVRTECSADLSVSASIPEEYVRSAEQRMDLYRRIALIRSEAEADDLTEELCDRFGDPPPEVNRLVQVALLRGEASAAGITEIAQKGGALRFVFGDFDFGRIQTLYSRPAWKGRVKIEAGGKPAVAVRLRSGRRILEEARAFIGDYTSLAQNT